MGAHGGPNMTEEGVVFYYDTGNGKSYTGEPTVNLVTNPDFSTGDYSGWSSTSTSNGDVDITEVSFENGYNFFHKKVNKTINGGQDRLTQSSLYTINTSVQTTISIDIWINPSNAYSLTFYGLGSTADDTTYNEKPLTSNGTTTTTIDLGDGWTRYIYTLSTAWYTGSGNTFKVAVYPGYSGRGLMEYKVKRVQVEQKSHATPFVNGTRSATEGLKDLTGNRSIDLSNISFDSNAQMTFDGTSDRFSIADPAYPSTGTDALTLEVVFKIPSSADWNNGYYTGIIGRGSYAGSLGLVRSTTNNKVDFWARINGGTTYDPGVPNLARDVYHHIIGTYNGTGLAKVYHNGEYVNQESGLTTGTFDAGDYSIGGGRSFSGAHGGYGEAEDIPVAKLYNRALTAEEVKSNFNGIRSRFGI